MAYVLRGTWSAVSDGYATVYVSGTARVRDQVSLGSGASLKITSGAFVDGLTAVKGSVSVAAGGVLANSQLDDSTLTVASGGIIQTNNLNSTETTLGSGAQSYNDTWFNSGYDANWVTVAAGASIMQSQILKGGYLRVSSGGSAAGVVVSAGGSAILASGTTDGFTAMSGGYVQSGTAFYSGSTVNGTELVNASVLSGTWSAVNLDGGTVYQSGTVIVSGPAVLGTSAVLYIKNGAVASQLSGYLVSVVIEAGGNLDSSVIINGSVRIAAGGASTNNALNSTATTVASGGSSFNDVWYNSGYDINVATFQSGASISGAQVLNGGSLSVQTGATGNDIYVSGTGTATFSAGSVENYTAAPGGKVVSGTMTYSGILVGDNSYDNTRVLSGVWSAIDSDGTTVFRSGSVSVQWPVTFASGATLYISSGAQVAGIKAVATTVQVLNGGALYQSTIENGTLTVASGGSTTGNYLNSTTTTYGSGASSLADRWYNSGYNVDAAVFQSGASVWGAVVDQGGSVTVSSGAQGSDITVYKGGSASFASGTVDQYRATSGGTLVSGSQYFTGMMIDGSSYDNTPLLAGRWTAVYDQGATVYTSGTTSFSWPVAMAQSAFLTVGPGATASSIYGTAITVTVQSGGTLTASRIANGSVTLASGASSINNGFNSTPVTISSGASSVADDWYNSGYNVDVTSVYAGATLEGVTIGNGGSMVVQSGVNLGNVSVDSAGVFVTSSPMNGDVWVPPAPEPNGAVTLTGTWSAVADEWGQTVYQSGTKVVSDSVALGNGATLYVMSGATALNLSGYLVSVYVSNGGTLMASYIRNGTVSVLDGGTTLGNQFNSVPMTIAAGGSSMNDTWFNSGYNVDRVTVASGGYVQSPSVGSGAILSAGPGATLTSPVVGQGGVLMLDHVALDPCFLAGTLIQTAQGEVAVENLQIGDEVICLDGEHRFTQKISWIGSRQNQHQPYLPLDQAGYPVCIRKNALADGVPSRDLYMTSEHCMPFEGAFIPLRMLVNGTSIYYDTTRPIYHYYHIEMERHAIILANNTPTESYLNTGHRRQFTHQASIPGRIMEIPGDWHSDAALPLNVACDFVQPVHEKLVARALSLGFESKLQGSGAMTEDPDFCLILENGTRIDPIAIEGARRRFSLPPGVRFVRLASHQARPCDFIGPWVDDRRRFGVCIGEVSLQIADRALPIRTHLDGVEREGWVAELCELGRWTEGYALLNLPSVTATVPALLDIEVTGTVPYRVDPIIEAPRFCA